MLRVINLATSPIQLKRTLAQRIHEKHCGVHWPTRCRTLGSNHLKEIRSIGCCQLYEDHYMDGQNRNFAYRPFNDFRWTISKKTEEKKRKERRRGKGMKEEEGERKKDGASSVAVGMASPFLLLIFFSSLHSYLYRK